MTGVDLDNLTGEQRKLIHTLYQEGYLSEESYLQLKARVSAPPKPQVNDELPSDEEFYDGGESETWHPNTENQR